MREERAQYMEKIKKLLTNTFLGTKNLLALRSQHTAQMISINSELNLIERLIYLD